MTVFSNLSIRSQMLGVVACLLVALGAIGLFALTEMRSINTATQEIHGNWLPSVHGIGALRAATNQYRGTVPLHILHSDAGAMARLDRELEASLRDVAEARRNYEALISSPEEQALYEDFGRAWDGYRREAEIVLAQSRKNDQAVARDLYETKAMPYVRAAHEVLTRLVDLNNKGAEAESRRSDETYAAALRHVIAALVLSIVVGFGAAILIVRSITRGIASVVTPMRALAAGDLTVAIPRQGERTEIGRIADAVQVFKDAMIAKKAVDEAAAASAGAKIRRAQRVDELTGEFETLISELVGSLSSASTELETAAGTLRQTAETTEQLSGSVAVASTQASVNVQSVAAATEEMISTIGEIARQVRESSRISSDAVKQAKTTDQRINQLLQAASRIGDVVKLITAIAEQTNLLALNATIEAARAGAAGKGFAVVAQEVKALATETAKATDEIGSQIAGMQAATKESVGAIKEIGATIGRLSEIATTVAQTVSEQGVATQEIAHNVSQAAQGTSQVAANIADVNQGATETGTASAQVFASEQSLGHESSRLEAEVEKFLAMVRAA